AALVADRRRRAALDRRQRRLRRPLGHESRAWFLVSISDALFRRYRRSGLRAGGADRYRRSVSGQTSWPGHGLVLHGHSFWGRARLRLGRASTASRAELALGILPGGATGCSAGIALLLDARTADRQRRRCRSHAPSPDRQRLPITLANAIVCLEHLGHDGHDFRDRRPGLLDARLPRIP